MFLEPNFPYFLLRTRFHFHMGAGSAGNLSVILQKGENRKLLWSRSSSTSIEWVPEHLPLGKQDQPYRVCHSECVWNTKHPLWVWSYGIHSLGSLAQIIHLLGKCSAWICTYFLCVPFKLIFSSQTSLKQEGSLPTTQTTALDDVSFHNCEKDFQPPGGESAEKLVEMEMNTNLNCIMILFLLYNTSLSYFTWPWH